MAEVEKLPEAEKIMEIPISYEEKGKEIGRKEGKIEGRKEGRKEVALELLKKGLSTDFIVEVTHMDVQEIKKLKEQL